MPGGDVEPVVEDGAVGVSDVPGEVAIVSGAREDRGEHERAGSGAGIWRLEIGEGAERLAGVLIGHVERRLGAGGDDERRQHRQHQKTGSPHDATLTCRRPVVISGRP